MEPYFIFILMALFWAFQNVTSQSECDEIGKEEKEAGQFRFI